MIIDKSQIKRILVITLSNLGDIILTTPAIRVLAREFPEARIDIMVGPAGKEIFDKDPRIAKVIIYDKHMPMMQKRRLQLKLKKLRYDIVADFRNTIFPLLIGPRYRTDTLQKFPKEIIHGAARHLYRLKSLGIKGLDEPSYIYIPEEDVAYVAGLLKESAISNPIIVINAAAKSHLKMWIEDGFAEVADRLIEGMKANVVFIGLDRDEEIVKRITAKMRHKAHNLVNKTTVRQLAALLKKADLVITNDSAPLHLACAVGAKVLAIFGPTDPRRYGPTGEFDVVIKKKLSCAPCESAACEQNYECMRLISPDEVLEAAKMMLEGYE